MSTHWPGQVQLGWEAGWLGSGCPWGSCWSSLGPDRPVHQQDPGEAPGAFSPHASRVRGGGAGALWGPRAHGPSQLAGLIVWLGQRGARDSSPPKKLGHDMTPPSAPCLDWGPASPPPQDPRPSTCASPASPLDPMSPMALLEKGGWETLHAPGR